MHDGEADKKFCQVNQSCFLLLLGKSVRMLLILNFALGTRSTCAPRYHETTFLHAPLPSVRTIDSPGYPVTSPTQKTSTSFDRSQYWSKSSRPKSPTSCETWEMEFQHHHSRSSQRTANTLYTRCVGRVILKMVRVSGSLQAMTTTDNLLQ